MYKTEDEMYDAKKNEIGAFVAKTVSHLYQLDPSMGNQYCIIPKQYGVLKCIILKMISLTSDCPLTTLSDPSRIYRQCVYLLH